MADYTPPDDLIKLRKDFLSTQKLLSAAGRDIPSQAAVAAGEAEVTSKQREAWWAAQNKCRELAVAILEHEHWATVEAGDKKRVEAQLREAAGG